MLVMKSGVSLVSESGMETTILDAGGQGRVILCIGVGAATSIEGFKITGGFADDGGGIFCGFSSRLTIEANWIVGNQAAAGAGIAVLGDSSPIIRSNLIEDNSALGGGGSIASGGGIICNFGGNTAIEDNVIRGNSSVHVGGGIFIYKSSAASIARNWAEANSATNQGGGLQGNLCNIVVTENVFVANAATYGGGVSIGESAVATIIRNTVYANSSPNGGGISVGSCSPVLEANIVACNVGSGIRCDHPDVTHFCNNSYGNSGSDFIGISPDSTDFSEDPLFCDPQHWDFTLRGDSPCIEGYGCGQIGAYGVGCGPTRAESMTWGSIKSMYR
jgi:hypothetical protein